MLKQCPVRRETPPPSACVGLLRTWIAAGGLQPPLVGKPRGRWLPSREGRCLRWWKGRWSSINVLANTFVIKCNARQVVAKKRRQMFVGGFCDREKTAVSIDHHCSLPIKRPVKHFQRDGSCSGAGDGIRTRDSLLGRQELYRLSYSRMIAFACRSGCADLNRGPHGPKPCALPTAPHPVAALYPLYKLSARAL